MEVVAFRQHYGVVIVACGGNKGFPVKQRAQQRFN